ncbi:LysR family transcriptional regulator [soil metagenome]
MQTNTNTPGADNIRFLQCQVTLHMNLRQIEVFRAVMVTGSTTDAARLLHVSQPGISRLIRHLELRLGVQLFERGKGRLVATPEAHTLQAEIEKVYLGVKHVQGVAEHLRFGSHATLRVLASANTGLQLVPRSIARLVGDFPQSRVFFETVSGRELVRTMVAEEADIAISSAPVDHPALQVREIGKWTLVCALRLDHPLASSKLLPLEKALADRLIVYSPEAPQTKAIDGWLSHYRIDRNVAVQVRAGYAACSMAAAGLGVAFVDDLSARAHRPEGLAFIAVPKPPRFPIYTVVNVNRPPSQMGKSFLAIAKQQLADMQKEPLTGP